MGASYFCSCLCHSLLFSTHALSLWFPGRLQIGAKLMSWAVQLWCLLSTPAANSLLYISLATVLSSPEYLFLYLMSILDSMVNVLTTCFLFLCAGWYSSYSNFWTRIFFQFTCWSSDFMLYFLLSWLLLNFFLQCSVFTSFLVKLLKTLLLCWFDFFSLLWGPSNKSDIEVKFNSTYPVLCRDCDWRLWGMCLLSTPSNPEL